MACIRYEAVGPVGPESMFPLFYRLFDYARATAHVCDAPRLPPHDFAFVGEFVAFLRALRLCRT